MRSRDIRATFIQGFRQDVEDHFNLSGALILYSTSFNTCHIDFLSVQSNDTSHTFMIPDPIAHNKDDTLMGGTENIQNSVFCKKSMVPRTPKQLLHV